MSEQQPSVTLDKTAMSVSIVVVIIAVVTLEKFFHLLHFLTKETAFSNMIIRIEKELMIVGSTAFIFRLIVAPSSLSTSVWGFALTYADLIVPIFSFCYCGIGVILIVSSLRQCSLWSKSYHQHFIELLDEFLEKSERLWFKWSWKPMNEIITKMEFRVFHALFCDFFLLKPKAFAFDEYVARVYEKYVFSIISIGTFHWLILACIVLLNWMRIALNIEYQSCATDDIDCEEFNNVVVFTCAGAVLSTITGTLVYVSRNLELKIMAKRDITSYKSYQSFLQSFEDGNPERKSKSVEKLDESGLREIVAADRIKALTEHLETEDFLVLVLFQCFAEIRIFVSRVLLNIRNTLFARPVRETLEDIMQRLGSWDDNDPDGSFRTRPSLLGGRRRASSNEGFYTLPSFLTSGPKIHARSEQYAEEEGASQEHSQQNQAFPSTLRGRSRNRSRTSSATNALEEHRHSSSGPNESHPHPQSHPPPATTGSPDHARRRTLMRLTSIKARKFSYQAMVLEVKGEYIKDLFWFSRPELYFETVRFFIMLLALYLALWLVDVSGADIGSGWKMLAILPGLFSAVNYLYIVKTAALLKAMYSMDFEAAEKVFQQTDAARDLERKIREKLRAKLRSFTKSDDLKSQVYEMFCEVDYDNSGFISRHEFSIYLSRLGVHMNRKQWKETFRNIDQDTSDTIEFHEFFSFLYPEHREAFEQKRLATIYKRVDEHQRATLNNGQEPPDIENGGSELGNTPKSPSRKASMEVLSHVTASISTAFSSSWRNKTIIEENCKEEADEVGDDNEIAVDNTPAAESRMTNSETSRRFQLGDQRSSESSSSSSSDSENDAGGVHPSQNLDEIV